MATILFYLRKPKSDTQNVREEFPINLKFTIDREHRLELSLGERIKPAHWNPDKQEAKSNYRGYIELNLYLSKLKQDLLQMWRDNRDKDFDTIKELTRGLVKYGEATKCKSLLEVFSDFLTQYSTEKDKKTIKKYNSLKINLTEFSKNYTVLLDKTDFNFYDRFKSFLYQRRNPNYPGQYLHKHPVDNYWYMSKTRSPYPACIFDDTVYKYISNLKAFLSWAEKRGHEVHESYKSWEIITRTYKHISLSLPELEQIEAAEMPTKSLELARDYFILECRTGQRISDIKAFNKKDFENGKWSFYRKKGSRLSPKKVTVHFSGYSTKALTIFAKYNFEIPKISEQKLNQNIKKVCEIAGITKEIFIERWAGNKCIRITGKKSEFISTHTGRKTFITIALQFMPPKLVKDLTGIEDYKTLKHYEGESEAEIIEGYLNKIEEGTYLRKAQ